MLIGYEHVIFKQHDTKEKDSSMSVIRITQSVGLGGANSLSDVKTALNNLLKLIPPTQALIIDGRLESPP